LDPDESELASLEGGGCFAFIFATGVTRSLDRQPGNSPEMVWSNWQPTTPFNENELVHATDLARAGSERMWATMKEIVGRMGTPFGVNDFTTAGRKETFSTDADDDDKMEI
jgi:exosome complex component RRP46